MKVEKCCGTCRFSKNYRYADMNGWYCTNDDSDCCGLETVYSECCEDYEEKER